MLNISPALIAGIGRSRFSLVQAPVLDIFDWEMSEDDPENVSQLQDGPKVIGQVENYVFTVPNEELPVIFQVQPSIGPILMRGDVRDLLKQCQIRGGAHKKPGKFSRTDQFVTDLSTTSTA